MTEKIENTIKEQMAFLEFVDEMKMEKGYGWIDEGAHSRQEQDKIREYNLVVDADNTYKELMVEEEYHSAFDLLLLNPDLVGIKRTDELGELYQLLKKEEPLMYFYFEKIFKERLETKLK